MVDINKRRFYSMVLAIVERVFGRKNLIRFSRFVSDYARRDLPNILGLNGEWLIQDSVLARVEGSMISVFDVGANIGLWSRRILGEAEQMGFKVNLHAFEPSAPTYNKLCEVSRDFNKHNISMVEAGVSNESGHGILYEIHELAGSNSLHGTVRQRDGLVPSHVNLIAIDDYCSEANVDHIHLLKIDTEGHDLLVLKGAQSLIKAKKVDVIQFEYNYLWIDARCFLKDAFELLQPYGYIIGKITPTGVEWYESWSPELETFREANYLATLSEDRNWFPSIKWWK